MSDTHDETSRLCTAEELVTALRQRAKRLAAALNEARQRDDDKPGDEVGTVAATDFGLRTVAVAGGRLSVGLADAGPVGLVMDVVWSWAKRFWYVDEVGQGIDATVEYAALDGVERAVYDVLARRGFSHVRCLAGVAEFQAARAAAG